jgi:hypothetical protein
VNIDLLSDKQQMRAIEPVSINHACAHSLKIHDRPGNPYLERWDIVILLCLFFTATFTPYEVAFLPSGKIDGIFWLNRFVDLLFIKDMIMNFLIMYHDGDGRLIKDMVHF